MARTWHDFSLIKTKKKRKKKRIRSEGVESARVFTADIRK